LYETLSVSEMKL